MADHPASSNFSAQSGFDLGLEMASRSKVVSENLHTESSPHCTPQGRCPNRTPASITKVSELSITHQAKSDLNGQAAHGPPMKSIQPQLGLTRRHFLRASPMTVPWMSPANQPCWSPSRFF